MRYTDSLINEVNDCLCSYDYFGKKNINHRNIKEKIQWHLGHNNTELTKDRSDMRTINRPWGDPADQQIQQVCPWACLAAWGQVAAHVPPDSGPLSCAAAVPDAELRPISAAEKTGPAPHMSKHTPLHRPRTHTHPAGKQQWNQAGSITISENVIF